MNLTPDTIKKLIDEAIKVRKNSYNPYSKFAVGATVLTNDGKIISGTNIENISFGLTVCAERVALFNAISQGYKNFSALAVVTEDGSSPCGACRQVILELCGNIHVIIAQPNYEYTVVKAEDLLPLPFKTHALK